MEIMEIIEEDKLKLLEMYFKGFSKNLTNKSKWNKDTQCFALWYQHCNALTKKRAEQIYGLNIINQIVEYADEKNFIGFEMDYQRITDYDKPDQSWRLWAWGCANYFDNSSDKIKEKILKKYGMDFVSKVLKYREDFHKRNRELYESKFSKDVLVDIAPIMPLLDNSRGILFYSKNNNKIYVFDEMPIKISSDIGTKKNIRVNGKLLIWEESNYIYSYEHANLFAKYDSNIDTLTLSSEKTTDRLSKNYEGIYETIGEDVEKEMVTIKNLTTKVKDFDATYFSDKHNQFLETKKYIKNYLKINCF